MRKRIQQLASGKFDCSRPCLSLSTDKVELELLEGKDETGDFIITSTNRVKMRGIVYSSNPRMECLTPQFEGEEVKIRYTFHSGGLMEGDIQKGDFFIVCNQGEYNLSFVVSVSKLYADSSCGKMRSLSDFTRLAKESSEEACRLFYSNNFKNLLKEERERLFYEGLRSRPQPVQAVEEFLTALHRKKRVELFLEETEKSFYGIKETKKEQIGICRRNWGAVETFVSSDAAFLVPEKKRLTDEDFLGNRCFLEYYIDKEKMHSGKNFGKIYIQSPHCCLTFTVTATEKAKEEGAVSSDRMELQAGRIKLTQLYMDYRLKKIVTGFWANRSVEILEHLSAIEPENELWILMKAQAFLINRQKQEASWILSDYKRNSTDHTTPLWGYYLYLCTLMEREESYVNRLTEEIGQIFLRHPHSTMLFWILLFVKEEYYRNPFRRLKAIEQWVGSGNSSPYLYLEAYYLIWQDSYLLTQLDSFEIKILNWAAKQDVISTDIAMQVKSLLPEQREYKKQLYPIIERCYEADRSPEMVAAACSYFIRGQQFGTKYHVWYERGIESEIRITNLYEAFLLSMDASGIEPMPKMLQMYFQYHCTLPYKYMAVLYVNIIGSKDRQPELYQRYRRTMEQFAVTQLEAGHMDDNLAVIYHEILPLILWNEELARKAADILFVHRMSCKNPRAAQICVLQEPLKDMQIVPVVNGCAYFKAFTKQYVILFLDTEGNCFTEEDYQENELIDPENYLEKCMELAPDEPAYLVYYFSGRKQKQDLNRKDDRYIRALLESEKVRAAYKAKLFADMVRFCEEEKEQKLVQQYLQDAPVEDMTRKDRCCMEELLIGYQMYEKAYRFVQMFGYDYLKSSAKVSLCSYEIMQCGFEEDDYLIGFAQACFDEGKYNDVILTYLCRVFQGPTKQMAAIWKAAGMFEINTFDLEERIITQMLYSTDYVNDMEQIYESYCAKGGRELICMAYLSYFSHSYFVKDTIVPPHVFMQIKERYVKKMELNDICRLGLLKFLAEQEQRETADKKIADSLLAEFTTQNRYFSFYKKFEEPMLHKYHLYDKFFVEYHTEAGRRVILNYSVNGAPFQKEELPEIYDGIYGTMFILLFGEDISYYISEQTENGWKVTESSRLSNHDIYGDGNQSRYDRLNRMMFEFTAGDVKALREQIGQYDVLLHASKEIFTLL